MCAEEDDFGFIRNHLDHALAEELDLFSYQSRKDGEARVNYVCRAWRKPVTLHTVDSRGIARTLTITQPV